ncbi:Obp99c.2 family protein [Megaselia abdita]
MKLFLLLGFIVLASATRTVEDLRELRRECMESLPENLRLELRELKYSKDEKIMKYVHCVAEKMDIFGEDGFQPDKMSEIYKNKISKEDLQAIADRCLKLYKRKDYSKSEELAYYQWTCMLEDDKFKQLFQKNTN